MNQLIQQLITGLSIGGIYALLAVGYSLIYSIVNFANRNITDKKGRLPNRYWKFSEICTKENQC